MTTKIEGQLEIDHDRGVIYFHTSDPEMAEKFQGITLLRICNLPKPIPERAIDITHMVGVDYVPKRIKTIKRAVTFPIPKELIKDDLNDRVQEALKIQEKNTNGS